jgi:hypothetical protein
VRLVELELDPDPGDPLTRVIAEALTNANLLPTVRPAGYDAPWRRAALSEGVARSPGTVPLPPRNSAGATRA